MMRALWWFATATSQGEPSRLPAEDEMSIAAQWLIAIGIVVTILVVGYFGSKAKWEIFRRTGEYPPSRM